MPSPLPLDIAQTPPSPLLCRPCAWPGAALSPPVDWWLSRGLCSPLAGSAGLHVVAHYRAHHNVAPPSILTTNLSSLMSLTHGVLLHRESELRQSVGFRSYTVPGRSPRASHSAPTLEVKQALPNRAQLLYTGPAGAVSVNQRPCFWFMARGLIKTSPRSRLLHKPVGVSRTGD